MPRLPVHRLALWLSLLACGVLTGACQQTKMAQPMHAPTDATTAKLSSASPPTQAASAVTGRRAEPVPCPEANPTGNVAYYVCDCGPDSPQGCRAGSDDNAGTKPEKPFRTYERARKQFADLKPGSSIAFCRGGSFPIQPDSDQRWVNAACQAKAPCVVRDYVPAWGSAATRAPVIHAPRDSRVFSLENGGPAQHEEGYVFANLDLEGSGSGWAVFLYNDIDDVTMCNLVINDFELGVHLGGSDAVGPGSDGTSERISLRNSRITNNAGQGWLGAGSGTSIEGCYFENNGFGKAILNHNIYLSGDGARDVRVVGNELYRSAMISGKCQGTSLVVHGTLDGLRIERNLIREDMHSVEPTCWGIGVASGYDRGESFKNVTIDGNTIINVGNVSIGVNACQDCVVQNNVIVNEQGLNDAAIQAPAIDRGPGDATDEHIVVRNNSIYGDSGTGISLIKEGKRHEVVNNAIHLAGHKPSRCFMLDAAPGTYAEVDYNVCQAGERGEWAAGHAELADWTKATGFDKHSTRENPGFLSLVAPYNLACAKGSPLAGKGDPRNSPRIDQTGKARPEGAPDIGAVQQ